MTTKQIFSSFLSSLLLLSACGSNNGKNNNTKINEAATEELKTAVAEEIKSWGAKDAYFDDNNYFVYCVNSSEISTNANEVAEAMFHMVDEVPGVKGCRVVDFKTNKELGRYKKN